MLFWKMFLPLLLPDGNFGAPVVGTVTEDEHASDQSASQDGDGAPIIDQESKPVDAPADAPAADPDPTPVKSKTSEEPKPDPTHEGTSDYIGHTSETARDQQIATLNAQNKRLTDAIDRITTNAGQPTPSPEKSVAEQLMPGTPDSELSDEFRSLLTRQRKNDEAIGRVESQLETFNKSISAGQATRAKEADAQEAGRIYGELVKRHRWLSLDENKTIEARVSRRVSELWQTGNYTHDRIRELLDYAFEDYREFKKEGGKSETTKKVDDAIERAGQSASETKSPAGGTGTAKSNLSDVEKKQLKTGGKKRFNGIFRRAREQMQARLSG